jgi:hypothetical protein
MDLCITRVVFVKCQQSPVAGALSDGATGTTSANNWFQTGNIAILALWWHTDHYRAMYAPEIVLLRTAYISKLFPRTSHRYIDPEIARKKLRIQTID